MNSIKEYKYAYRAYWKLLFYSNQTNPEDFFDDLSVYPTIKSEKVYSNIQEESERPRSGKFEFLLEYPELNGYNRWKQNNFPLNEEESNNIKADGYEEIHISWRNYNWGGLIKSSSQFALIDGSVGNSAWYYAIGYTGKSHVWSGGTPGPYSLIHEVFLWIRINMHPDMFSLSKKRSLYLKYQLFYTIVIIIN